MRAALFWVAVVVAGALLTSFAISNRAMVELQLLPLPFVATLPLYLLVFAALIVGFVVGWLAAWFGGRRHRRESRRGRRRIGALERELAGIREKLGSKDATGPAELPVRH